MAKVNLFSQQLTVAANGLTGPALSRAAANIAINARNIAIQEKRASPRYNTYVDTVLNAKEETVKKTIVYEFLYSGDAVQFALDTLIRMSPFGPKKASSDGSDGRHYRDSFALAIDGRIIRASSFDATLIGNANEVTIFNMQPYGRKVDTQRIGHKTKPKGYKELTFSNVTTGAITPTDFFASVVTIVKQRYGNTVDVRRVYTVNVPNQWVRKTGDPPGRLVEYPAIIISSLAG